MRTPITLEQFIAGFEGSRMLFDLARAAIEDVAPSEMGVTKSQVSFSHGRGFAWLWMPGRYMRGPQAPLVLSVGLSRRDDSPRWKEVVEPSPGRFVHHLEVYDASQIDDEVRAWLREAWEGAAGSPRGRRVP